MSFWNVDPWKYCSNCERDVTVKVEAILIGDAIHSRLHCQFCCLVLDEPSAISTDYPWPFPTETA